MARISITIDAENADDLNRTLAILGSASGTAPAAAAKTETKAPAKAADKPKAEEPKEEPAAEEGPSLADCKAAMAVYDKANGREALGELLGRFGIRNISALPAAQYAEFIAACEG
jgi:ribosomal protein L12E/L44/L45/RPP1/RPP2